MDGRAQGKTYCVLSHIALIGPLRARPSPREPVFPETNTGKLSQLVLTSGHLVPDNGPIGSAPPPADRDAAKCLFTVDRLARCYREGGLERAVSTGLKQQ